MISTNCQMCVLFNIQEKFNVTKNAVGKVPMQNKVSTLFSFKEHDEWQRDNTPN